MFRHFQKRACTAKRICGHLFNPVQTCPAISRGPVFAVSRLYSTANFKGKSSDICKGCGAHLQTTDSNLVGYIPEIALNQFSDGWRKRLQVPCGVNIQAAPANTEVSNRVVKNPEMKSTLIYCQSCYRLQQYRTLTAVPPASDPGAPHDEVAEVQKLVRSLTPGSVVVSIVDILDFESSMVPDLHEALMRRGIPIITLLNKCDCLPISSSRWKDLVPWAQRISKLLRSNDGPDGKHSIIPVSSSNDHGFDALEKRLQLIAPDGASIFVMGRVNSGKSTFITRFLRHIGYKHLGCVHYKRGVGGLTRAPVPSTTKDFIHFPLPNKFTLIDSPGITSKIRMDSHLISARDFFDVSVRDPLQPVTLSLREGRTLILGAMCRIHLESGTSVSLTCFVSPKVTLHVCSSTTAESLLRRKAGVFFYPPHSESESLAQEHPIVKDDWVCHKVRVFCSPTDARDDIMIPGLGWISAYGQGHKVLYVTVPRGVKIFRRPALIPRQIHQSPTTPFHFRQRARSLRVNVRKKRFIRLLRNEPKTNLNGSASEV